MALNLATTPEVQVVRLTKALFDAAPGNTYLTNFTAAASAYGMDALAAELIKYAGATTAPVLANLVVTNLGLTGAAAANGKAYLEANLGQAKDLKGMGKVIIDALNALATMESDPTYGEAAKTFNQQVTNGYNFSINPANTTTNLAQLHAALQVTSAPVAAQQGAEQRTLTADNNTITATLTTIGAGDAFVDPSTTDQDTLNLAANTSNVTGPFNGLRLVNIETLTIDATGFNNVGNATVFDLMAPQSNIEGLRTINVTGNGVAGDVILANVRDSVTTIDASGLQNNALRIQGPAGAIADGIAPNIGGTTTNTARTVTGSGQADFIGLNNSGGNDTVNGGGGNDFIATGGGNDVINGGGGADTISGGAGADTITGGDGADIFFLDQFDSADTITDFATGGGDVILIDLAAGQNQPNGVAVITMNTVGLIAAGSTVLATNVADTMPGALPMSALFVANTLAGARALALAAANAIANANNLLAFALVGSAAMSRRLVLFTLSDTAPTMTGGARAVSTRTLAIVTGSPTQVGDIVLI